MSLFSMIGTINVNGVDMAIRALNNLNTATNNVRTGLNNMSSYLQTARTNISNLSNGLGNVGNRFMTMGSSISSFGNTLVNNVTTPILGLIKSGVDYNATLEMLSTQFEVLTGSAETAGTMLEDIKTMAKKTPFEVTGLAEAAETLLVYGVNQEKVLPLMSRLGDVAMGNNEHLKVLTYNMAQINSLGRLQAGDLRSLTLAGWNPLNDIMDMTGETMEEVKARMKEGKISFEEVQKALEHATDEGGRFYKGMEKGSATLTGQLSNLTDAFNELLGNATKPLFDFLRNIAVPALNKLVDEFNKLPNAAKQGILIFAGIVAAVGPLVVLFGTLVTGVGLFIIAIGNILSPVGLVVTAVTLLTTLLGMGGLLGGLMSLQKMDMSNLGNVFEGVKKKAQDLWDFIQHQLKPAFEYLASGDATKLAQIDDKSFRDSLVRLRTSLTDLQDRFEEAFGNVKDIINNLDSGGFGNFASTLADGATFVIDQINKMYDAFKGFQKALKPIMKAKYKWEITVARFPNATKEEIVTAAYADWQSVVMEAQDKMDEIKELKTKLKYAATLEDKSNIQDQINKKEGEYEKLMKRAGEKELKYNKKMRADVTINDSDAKAKIAKKDKDFANLVQKELKGTKLITIKGNLNDSALQAKIDKHNKEIKLKVASGELKSTKHVTIDATVNDNPAKSKINAGHNDVKNTTNAQKNISATKKVTLNANTNTNPAKSNINAGHNVVKNTVNARPSYSSTKGVTLKANTNTNPAKSNINSGHNDVKNTVQKYKNLSTTKSVKINAKTDTSNALSAIKNAFSNIVSWARNYVLPSITKTIGINANTNVNKKAKGGSAEGLTLVGEEGAELIDLPPGSYVHNHKDTVKMLARGSENVNEGWAITGEEGAELQYLNKGSSVYSNDKLNKLLHNLNATNQQIINVEKITIDAKNVKEFNDVIKVFDRFKVEKATRGGR